MEEYSKIYPELKEADRNNFGLYQIAKYLSESSKNYKIVNIYVSIVF